MTAQPDRAVPAEDIALGRAAQAALLACGLFMTLGLFSPGLVLPQIEQTFSTTPHVTLLTELVGTLASFAFAIGAPIAGMLVARFGSRRIILPALVAFAITGAAPLLLNDLWLILLARIGTGLSLSGIFTGALAGIGALAPDRRARMFGWFAVVGGVAAIVLFPIIGALGQMGWRPAFAVNLVALLAIPLVALLPPALGRAPPAHTATPATGRLLNPAMLGLLGLATLTGMSMLIAPIYAPLHLASLGIIDTRLLAIPVTLGSIAAVFASAAYGWLHQRFGLNGVSALAMTIMGGALIGAGLATQVELFTLAVVIPSAMAAIMAPNINATALAIAPPGKGSQALGIASGIMFGSQLLFPFLATWIRGHTGLSGVFMVFGLVILLAGALVAARLAGARRRASLLGNDI